MSLWGKRKGFRGFKEQEKVLKFDRPLAGEFRFRGFCDLWSQKGAPIGAGWGHLTAAGCVEGGGKRVQKVQRAGKGSEV